MRFVLLCTALLLAAPHGSLAQSDRYEGPIVDVHVHAYARIQSANRFCFPQPCEGAATQLSSGDELKPATIATMEQAGIVVGVLSGTSANVAAWTADNEDRFIRGIFIRDPSTIDLAELRRQIVSGQVQVVGEILSQYAGIAADDPRLDPVFALAHELDVPVHIHLAGLGGSADFRSDLGNPLRLVPVLGKYPGLRIYIENASWPFVEEVTSLMYQYPSVYADISTVLHLFSPEVAQRHLRNLTESGLGKRLMFGSDQMSWPEVMGEAIGVIQDADFLTREQKADILYNNAAEFFRFTDRVIAEHHRR